MQTHEKALTLPAELLLLAIDPKRGGLLARERRRFVRAMAVAAGIEAGREPRGWRIAGRRARRAALRELREAGLVARGRRLRGPRLTDSTVPGKRFRPIRETLMSKEGSIDAREATLLLLLAYSGLLAHRLDSRQERRQAYRKLQPFIQQPDAAVVGSLIAVGDFDFLTEPDYDFVNEGFGAERYYN